MIVSPPRAAGRLVEVGQAARIDREAASDGPAGGGGHRRGDPPIPLTARTCRLADPYENKGKYREHVAQVVIEAGLRADQRQDRDDGGVQDHLVTPAGRGVSA